MEAAAEKGAMDGDETDDRDAPGHRASIRGVHAPSRDSSLSPRGAAFALSFVGAAHPETHSDCISSKYNIVGPSVQYTH